MSPSEVHHIRNLLAVILGRIETGNLDLAKQAVYSANSYLTNLTAIQEHPTITPDTRQGATPSKRPQRSSK